MKLDHFGLNATTSPLYYITFRLLYSFKGRQKYKYFPERNLCLFRLFPCEFSSTFSAPYIIICCFRQRWQLRMECIKASICSSVSSRQYFIFFKINDTSETLLRKIICLCTNQLVIRNLTSHLSLPNVKRYTSSTILNASHTYLERFTVSTKFQNVFSHTWNMVFES